MSLEKYNPNLQDFINPVGGPSLPVQWQDNMFIIERALSESNPDYIAKLIQDPGGAFQAG